MMVCSRWYAMVMIGLQGCFYVVLTLDCDVQRDTCEYNANLPLPLCYCDKQCFYFNDCCKEALQSHVSFVRKEANWKEQFCVPLTNENRPWTSRIGSFMITKCHKEGIACQRNDSLHGLLPVSTEGTTFLNAECAVCNGVEKYESWNIVFHIPEQNNILSSFGDNAELRLGYVEDEHVLEYIFKKESSLPLYYLQEPTTLRPRFCLSDFINETYNVNEELTHQNIVNCEDKYFNNIEKCNADGCCLSEPYFCFFYPNILPYLDKYSIYFPISSGVKVLVNMSAAGYTSTLQEKEHGHSFVPPLFYLDLNEIMIELEVNESVNSTSTLDNCIQSTIVYVSFRYKLATDEPFFKEILLEEKGRLFEVKFRSEVMLTATDVNSLIHLNSSVYCVDRSVPENLTILIRVIGISRIHAPIREKGSQFKLIKSAQFKTSTSQIIAPCEHVRIVLHPIEKGIRLFVVECQSKDFSLRINGTPTHSNRSSLYILACFAVLLIVNFI